MNPISTAASPASSLGASTQIVRPFRFAIATELSYQRQNSRVFGRGKAPDCSRASGRCKARSVSFTLRPILKAKSDDFQNKELRIHNQLDSRFWKSSNF